MGTRGAFGVIIGEKEKIGYNQLDSYPECKGIENLRWLRGVVAHEGLEHVKQQAAACKLVSNEIKPTDAEIEHLRASTDLSVSEQDTDDWYCLTRGDGAAVLS